MPFLPSQGALSSSSLQVRSSRVQHTRSNSRRRVTRLTQRDVSSLNTTRSRVSGISGEPCMRQPRANRLGSRKEDSEAREGHRLNTQRRKGLSENASLVVAPEF